MKRELWRCPVCGFPVKDLKPNEGSLEFDVKIGCPACGTEYRYTLNRDIENAYYSLLWSEKNA